MQKWRERTLRRYGRQQRSLRRGVNEWATATAEEAEQLSVLAALHATDSRAGTDDADGDSGPAIVIPVSEFVEMDPTIQQAVLALTPQEQSLLWQNYSSRKRSVPAMVALAVFFPIQLFLLDKTSLGIAFWLTGWGLAIWWIVEWFKTPERVHEYNEKLLLRGLEEIAISRGVG